MAVGACRAARRPRRVLCTLMAFCRERLPLGAARLALDERVCIWSDMALISRAASSAEKHGSADSRNSQLQPQNNNTASKVTR